jgi:dethiobiotin synthetase
MRVVILGTGTDVGKTYVTACLARALSASHRVLALKPIESGVELGELGDAGSIAAAARHAPRLSPWRLRRPVSPHLAAREQGLTLALDDVSRWVADQERGTPHDWCVVETAGGAFSPLAPGVTNADLAEALRPALWVLVAPDRLGVLHDVTATLRALPRAPDTVLLSGSRPTDPSSGTNAEELTRLGICEVLETLPPLASELPRTVSWLMSRRDGRT